MNVANAYNRCKEDAMSDLAALREAIEKAQTDPALGRSALVRKLFEYLAESSLAERSPKETEVAIEVFGRRPDFDATRDAVARVYVHKLRRRLEQMDDGRGFGLTIPRGEYRLTLREQDQEETPFEPSSTPRARRWRIFLLPVIASMGAIGGWTASTVFRDTTTSSTSNSAAVSDSPIWRSVIANGRPTIIAIGDYYIFGDVDQQDGAVRLVREFSVNSASDLDQFMRAHPERSKSYTNLDLNYLPVGSASVLMNVARALSGNAEVRVMPVSSLKAPAIRDVNVIYIGYLSGLGPLRDAVFAGSRYSVGETYDDIIDTRTDQRFEGGGGKPHAEGTMYMDYGYLSTFAGPTGNRFVIIAGTRDAALMQMGQNVVNQSALDALAKAGGTIGSAEALYGISSMNQVNVDSRLIRTSPLDQKAIWLEDDRTAHKFPDG